MIRSLLLLISSLACAQDLLTRGADVFAKSCATGYCHGVKGVAGGAPRLAARGFDETYIATVTRAGVPGTAMQAFGTALSRGDLAAVVAYVASLNGITASRTAPAATGPEPKALATEATPGHDLFFDSVRGFGRCATCHQVDGLGIPVAAPIAKIPEDVAALRALATPQVRTATAEGESFPALVVSQGKQRTTLYDLTSAPPVQRTFDSSAVKIVDGSVWSHASALGSYRDADLESILVYLRAVTK